MTFTIWMLAAIVGCVIVELVFGLTIPLHWILVISVAAGLMLTSLVKEK